MASSITENRMDLKRVKSLVEWFERQKRILPWRETLAGETLMRDPYRVWISEMMLQQTQVATVIPYFLKFMKLFPKVSDLAAAPEETVMKAWAGLGYYSRARNLQKGAKSIVARGAFPTNLEEWLEVPGVGPYTAGAICSLSFGHYVPLVDGNVERVFSRLFLLSRSHLGEKKYREEMWRLATEGIGHAKKARLPAGPLNEGWMELGATVCTTRNPLCSVCALSRECAAFKGEHIDEYPEKKLKPEKVYLQEKVIAVVDLAHDRVILQDSALKKWRKGLWDFPEHLEELGEAFAMDDFKESVFKTKHVVTHHKIERETRVIHFESIPKRTQKLFSQLKPGTEWVNIENPDKPLGSASRKVLELLRERFYPARIAYLR